MVLGRISLYLENIPQGPDVSEQQRRLDELRTKEAQLDDSVSADAVQAKMDSCLSNVNRYLSSYAKKIDLKYLDSQLRLDPRGLTIVQTPPQSPVSLLQIGRGENTIDFHPD